MVRFGMLLVFLVHMHSLTSAILPECENCGCCVDKKCKGKRVEGGYRDEVCTEGCIDGYGGHKCYNKCPKDCVTCEQAKTINCATCADGLYLHASRRCVDCPDRCKQCTSETKCQECNFPYNNDDTTTDCSLSCPRNCLCGTPGVCSSCKDGYYNLKNDCLDACLDTCKTCTDQTHCQSCKPSYSGDMCCIQEGHCRKCLSSTVCEKCAGGYHGDKCNLTCLTTCQIVEEESPCKQSSGICKSCEDGSYGDYCSTNCSRNCLQNRCNKEDGHCTDGCAGSYEGPKCMQVKSESGMIGAAVGGGLASFVILIVIVIVVIVVLRRRKMKQLRKFQEPANIATYVNTLQTSSTDAVDICVINEQIDQSDYERLDKRNNTSNDDYDQIKSVNQ